MDNEGIRSYGPGKFDTILDSYVYDVSLDGGPDGELGDSEGFGWFGLMRDGKTIFRDHDPFLETLNDAERTLLESSAGVIICSDSQGFVSVSYYETDEALNEAWNTIVAEYEEFESEDEDEER